MVDYNSEEYTKNRLSRLTKRLMQNEMSSIDTYQEALDELIYVCDSSEGQLRTDAEAFAEDIRTKLSGDETGHLNLLSKWQAHFGDIEIDEISADIPKQETVSEGKSNAESD